MKTIRFTSKDEQEKLFTAALKKNVNDYFVNNNISTKANSTMVLKTIIMLALYLVPFIILLSIPMSLWLAFLLVVIMGIGIAGVGMGVMHDACHGAYSDKPWVNQLVSGSLYLLGSNVLNWKIQHNVLHHTYTNIAGFDEDIDDKGPIRLSENKPLKKYHRFQFIYAFFFYGLMTINMLVNDFFRLFNYNKLGLVGKGNALRNEFIKMLLRKVVYLSLILGLPLYFTNFSFLQILVGFFIMHWVASIILSFVFQMAHVVEGAEQPLPADNMNEEWSVHQLRTTSDFARNNKFIGWFVGGLNFQIEHHLFTTICHVHYPKLAPIVQRTAEEYGIPYNLKSTFGSALWSHISKLIELGKEPSIGIVNK